MIKKEDILLKFKNLFIIFVTLISIQSFAATTTTVSSPSLKILFNDFKHYTTTDTSIQWGDLYEHSIWTANAVALWWKENKFWVDGIDKKDQDLTIIAAALHAIGIGGDLEFVYKDKEYSSYDGFSYLLGKETYFLSDSKKFDFNRLFKELLISDENKKIIAIVTGAYGDFEGRVLKNIREGILTKEEIYQDYLEKLRSLAYEAGYKKGAIDERLVKIAVLIGAADIKGTAPVNFSENIFKLPDLKATHKARKNVYTADNVEAEGKKVREELLSYYKKHQKTHEVSYPKEGFPQTSAFLHLPFFKDIVTTTYGKEIQKYKKIIDPMMEKEQELFKTHFVFYHGTKIDYYVLQRIAKAFYQLMYPLTSSLTEYHPLRVPQIPMFDHYKTIDQFVEDQIKYNTEINDQAKALVLMKIKDKLELTEVFTGSYLLSVNVSLFGNIGPKTKSENSFNYFTADVGHAAAPNIKGIIETDILQAFGFNPSYAQELADLANMIRGDEGAILQIFIPKNLVDKYIYLARNWGKPYGNSTALGILFDRELNEKERMDKFWELLEKDPAAALGSEERPSEILEKYEKDPLSIPYIDRLQARILMSNDFILNPSGGSKIFSYTVVPKDKMKAFDKKLAQLTEKIFAEFLKKNKEETTKNIGK